MDELIIDAWTAAVNRLCQFTVDRLPAIITASTLEAAKINLVLSETSSMKSLLRLFEKSHNEGVARIIASKCEYTFIFWQNHLAELPASAASELARIEKLFHIVAGEVSPAPALEQKAV
ncbi:hypothetical protein [Oleiharenicola lentus]|uniref:hypothetical protein n=1 Tax=Oleiharenicola lentus TaxID=2508720 RepID=UPI003F67BA23